MVRHQTTSIPREERGKVFIEETPLIFSKSENTPFHIPGIPKCPAKMNTGGASQRNFTRNEEETFSAFRGEGAGDLRAEEKEQRPGSQGRHSWLGGRRPWLSTLEKNTFQARIFYPCKPSMRKRCKQGLCKRGVKKPAGPENRGPSGARGALMWTTSTPFSLIRCFFFLREEKEGTERE